MSSANCCEFVFTGSAVLLRLARVFVGTPSSSSFGEPTGWSAPELEYPDELDDELELLAPELPASCNPPGGAGFTSPAPPDDDDDDDPCASSPGYGNCCAGLFGACWALEFAGAFGAL